MAQVVKCVVVGDGAVGKTCLCHSYVHKHFLQEYVPTVFESYAEKIDVEGKSYMFGIWDTAGQEEYDQLRVLSYPNTDVFVVCFSVVSPASFSNIKLKWIPEIVEHCPNTPLLLVGTMMDLREDEAVIQRLAQRSHRPISKKQGKKLAKELKLSGYVECSSLHQIGVQTVFEEALQAAIHPPKRKQHTGSKCVIL